MQTTSLFDNLDPKDCVHLAIDWQESWKFGMGEFTPLLVPRLTQFTDEIRRLGVPTIWVVWPEVRGDTRDARKEGKMLSLASIKEILGQNDGLLSGHNGDFATPKYTLSAFSNRRLAPFICQKLKRHTVLVSGLFRGACVAATLEDKKNETSLSFLPLIDIICPDIITRYGERLTRIREGDYRQLIEDNRSYYTRLVAEDAYNASRFAVSTSDDVMNSFVVRAPEKGAARIHRAPPFVSYEIG